VLPHNLWSQKWQKVFELQKPGNDITITITSSPYRNAWPLTHKHLSIVSGRPCPGGSGGTLHCLAALSPKATASPSSLQWEFSTWNTWISWRLSFIDVHWCSLMFSVPSPSRFYLLLAMLLQDWAQALSGSRSRSQLPLEHIANPQAIRAPAQDWNQAKAWPSVPVKACDGLSSTQLQHNWWKDEYENMFGSQFLTWIDLWWVGTPMQESLVQSGAQSLHPGNRFFEGAPSNPASHCPSLQPPKATWAEVGEMATKGQRHHDFTGGFSTLPPSPSLPFTSKNLLVWKWAVPPQWPLK
jgi:hypothetical protein